MNAQACWFRDGCRKATDSCRCMLYDEMLALFKQSGLPEDMWHPIRLSQRVDECDYRAYAYLAGIHDDICDFVGNGESLYIYSRGVGNGKTSWSVKLMQAYFSRIALGNKQKRRGIFIGVPAFLDRERQRMDGNTDDSYIEMRNELPICDMVVWDDISAARMTDYGQSVLFSIIDARCAAGKCNIYTGNLDGNALAQHAGGRLASRIWNGSTVIEFKGEDRRAARDD